MKTNNKSTKSPAAQLIAARERAGLTQAEAARLLEITRQHLNSWERGRKNPSRASLRLALTLLAEAEKDKRK